MDFPLVSGGLIFNQNDHEILFSLFSTTVFSQGLSPSHSINQKIYHVLHKNKQAVCGHPTVSASNYLFKILPTSY